MKRKEAIVFTALLLFSILPNLLIVCMAEDVATIGQRLWYIATTLALYGFGLALFHRRAYLYIISLGFFSSAFEIFHVCLRHTTTSLLYLYMWLKTPPKVIAQMAWEHIGWIIIGVILWIGFYVVAHHWVKREWIGSWRWRIPCAIVCAVFFFFSPMSVCPTNILTQLSHITAMAVQVEKSIPEQRTFTYNITPNTNKAEETVIVVLSETSYEQWQSIAYRDSLAICFNSIYASCPASGVSMPLSLSRATADDKAPFFVERSIIRAFDEAGFYTAWLSNYGYHDHFLMRIADDCRYLTYRPDEPDTVLLASFNEVMHQPSQRHMVVLATRGGKNKDFVQSTTCLLRQLTDSLRTTHQPAILLYAGFPNIHLTDNQSELHMPLMIWTNPNYRYRHRSLIRTLNEQQNQRLSADYIFHTLLYMNNIQCVQWEERLSLGNQRMAPCDTIRYLDENLNVQEFIP